MARLTMIAWSSALDRLSGKEAELRICPDMVFSLGKQHNLMPLQSGPFLGGRSQGVHPAVLPLFSAIENVGVLLA
jgi:hypothetical protein